MASTDELHPRLDHIRGVGEGVFHVDGFCTVFSYRVFLYRYSCGSFSEAEFSLELRIRLRVRVQRQPAASAEEKIKFYYKNRKSFISHLSAKNFLLQFCCVFR